MATGVVILPKPVKAVQGAGTLVDLRDGVTVNRRGGPRCGRAGVYGAGGCGRGGGRQIAAVDPRRFGGPSIMAEGYTLNVEPSGVTITARDAAGASHALRSLAQQAAFEANDAPAAGRGRRATPFAACTSTLAATSTVATRY